MDFNLSEELKRLVNKATMVAQECLETRAAQYDVAASHPWESWRDLWEHGFLAIAIHREYGGLGLDILPDVMTAEKLAYGYTNTAMTHTCTLWSGVT